MGTKWSWPAQERDDTRLGREIAAIEGKLEVAEAPEGALLAWAEGQVPLWPEQAPRSD